MNDKKSDQVELMEGIAEARIEELTAEYREVKESDLDHIDTSRLDDWFEGYLSRHETDSDVKEDQIRQKKHIGRSKWFGLSRVAVLALVFLVAGSAVALNTEAIRLRFFGLFTESTEEYTILKTGESNELIQYIEDNWQGAFYLEMIPEDYHLTDINEFGTSKTMIFTLGDDYLRFYQDEDNESVAIDTEDSNTESLMLEGQQAYYNEKETDRSLIWVNTEGTTFRLSSNTFGRADLIQIAEKIKKND